MSRNSKFEIGDWGDWEWELQLEIGIGMLQMVIGSAKYRTEIALCDGQANL